MILIIVTKFFFNAIIGINGFLLFIYFFSRHTQNAFNLHELCHNFINGITMIHLAPPRNLESVPSMHRDGEGEGAGAGAAAGAGAGV